MEILLACIILYSEDFMTADEYENLLHAAFMEDPDSDFLLELEWNSSDMRQSIITVRNYCSEQRQIFNYDIFGQFLFRRLREFFYQDDMDIDSFGGRMYCFWETLPPWIQDLEPFCVLSYADDPLSWGDKKQTREIYESTLWFYDEKIQ